MQEETSAKSTSQDCIAADQRGESHNSSVDQKQVSFLLMSFTHSHLPFIQCVCVCVCVSLAAASVFLTSLTFPYTRAVFM